MMVGERIKQRLREIGKTVKWLSQVTRIPASTLYDLVRGDISSTPRLPTIAAALGVNALWLESGTGPKLLEDGAGSKVHGAYGWPFSFAPERWDRLSAAQKRRIEEIVEGMILAFESSGISSHQKSRARRIAG